LGEEGNCSLGLGWLPVREALALSANEGLVREIPSRELREARESNWDFPLDKRARSFTQGAIGVTRRCFSERNRYAVCVCARVPLTGVLAKREGCSCFQIRSISWSINHRVSFSDHHRDQSSERGLAYETMGDVREKKICWTCARGELSFAAAAAVAGLV